MADLNLLAEQTFRIAVAHHRAGRIPEAQRCFEETLRLQPAHLQAMVLLAAVLLDVQRPREAFELTAQALLIDPANLAAHVAQGHANRCLNRPAAAIANFDRALELNPDLASVHLSRGVELHKIRCYAAALECFDRALACDPELAATHCARGVALDSLERHREALSSYGRALSIQPDHVDALVNRGACLMNLGELDAALASYDEAIAIRNDSALTFANRGLVLTQLMRLDEAIASCDRALSLDPEFADAHVNRGVALAYSKKWPSAIASYDRAIALEPEHVRAHVNKSSALLSVGDLANGWPEYEWRLREAAQTPGEHSYQQPIWRGQESLAGKTILLYAECGLGDSIQFCRYAIPLADMGAKVLLSVQPPLRRLLLGLDERVQVCSSTQPLPAFDCCCPLMTLPLAFGTTLSSIPGRAAYLRADREQVQGWSQILGARRGPRVGLVWSGGFRSNQPYLWPIDRRRNIPLEKLAPLASTRCEFYSLQKGPHAEAELEQLVGKWAGPVLIDHTNALHDFSDTAALIENLDLVISVDTSTAHLSAALGKPTWILNRFDGCWRWLSDRNDSPWYPAVRLYAQEAPGDWSGVVERIRSDLVEFRI
jgi:tetratricopeptide (TPR) repeat protein